MALSVMDTPVEIEFRRRTFKDLPFQFFQNDRLLIHFPILSENRKIPAMQEVESCRLTEVTAIGFTASIISSDALKAVGVSYSFKSTSAKMNRICMTHALVTEGVNPVTAANRMSAGIPINAVSPRFLPESRKIIENRIETWRPETAMIWLMPLTLKEVFVS